MNSMDFVTDYSNDDTLRKSFNSLAKLIFSIDFEQWHELGFWTESYKTFSYADSGKIIANVSANTISALINNKKYKATQIGTVMTHPDYRKKGLAKALMQKALSLHERSADIIYLFPEDEAVEFYKKLGFSETRDSLFTLSINKTGIPASPPKKLSVKDKKNQAIIKDIYSRRHYSPTFDITDSFHILTWYLCGFFKNYAFYIKSLDTVVICAKKNGILDIFAVLSPARPSLSEILSHINTSSVTSLRLHFTPDFSDLNISDFNTSPNMIIFYRGNIRFPDKFAHPVISQA